MASRPAVLPYSGDANPEAQNRQREFSGVSKLQKYDAAQIDKLEGLEAVRKRPGSM